jgi:outer membrane protein assembly factor BamB
MALTRREWLAAGGRIAVAALAAGATRSRAWASAPEAAPAERWPLPAHDLYATRLGGALLGTALRWRAQLSGGVPGAPAIVEGTVYAASFGGDIAAFDLATGTERWRQALGTATYGSDAGVRALGFFGGVAVAQTRVIAAAERVFCLDTASGELRWSSVPLRSETSDDYFWAPPVIADELVLCGSGSGSELPTARGQLSAFALRDGTLVWRTPMTPADGNLGPPSVDRQAGLVYVATGAPYAAVAGSNPGTCALVALRLEDGRIAWVDQVYPGNTQGFDFNSAPVVVGPVLVAANKDGFYAWDRQTGARLWSERLTPSLTGGQAMAGPMNGPEGGPVATDGERVYVVSNDADHNGSVAAALDPGSGAVLWRRALASFSFAAPAIAQDRLAVVGVDGTVRLLAVADGAPIGELPLGEPSSGAPAAAGGVLVVGTGAGPFLPGDSLLCLGE